MKSTRRFQWITIISTILLAGLLATSGCDAGDDDDCQGAGCLSPQDGVDGGGPFGDVSCERVCNGLFEACGPQPLKLGIDHSPGNIDDCVIVCEKGFSIDERRCLFEAGCDGAASCLEDVTDLW